MRATRMITALLFLWMTACDSSGPELSGEFTLSSELYGTTSYYLYGYHYGDGAFYKYPGGGTLPDIINEGYLVNVDSVSTSVPGFHTPGQVNGFALAGSFQSAGEAKAYFDGFTSVDSAYLFDILSDPVELHQVWIQKTSSGNYVKLLVKKITSVDPEFEKAYSEVLLEYSYQPDGSTVFPE